MILERLTVGQLQVNCYILGCERTRQALVVDPGDEAERILAALREAELTVTHIVLTHAHFDHILAAEALRAATAAPICIHADEAAMLQSQPALFRMFAGGSLPSIVADQLLQDGDRLVVGDLTVAVLHTPGHSPGGISLWVEAERIVLSGDALFAEGIGRTDFPGSDGPTLLESIRARLLTLSQETVVYPGHGPETTVRHEKRHNPWLGRG
jgi:glyoxylase-like metal-dependent hydrolase (beta-lactamase superfamily II)